MNYFSKQNLFKRLIAQILIISFLLAGLGPVFLLPKPAQAIGIPVIDSLQDSLQTSWFVTDSATNIVQTASMAINTATNFWQQTNKILKEALKLAWQVVRKRLLNMLVNDTINWIQGRGPGDGGPRFITNWQDFLNEAAGAGAQSFLWDLTGVNFCDPFKSQMRLAFEFGNLRDRLDCTFSELTGFFDNFIDGGWGGWIKMTTQPRNNLYGAYLMSLDEMYGRSALSLETAGSKGIAGGGILGDERCTACYVTDPEGNIQDYKDKDCWGEDGLWDIIPPGGTFQCTKTEIFTPGKIVGDTVAKKLDFDYDWLIASDEISRSLAAIIDAVINRVAREGLSVMQSGSGSWTESRYDDYQYRGQGGGTWLEELAEIFAQDLSEAQTLYREQERIKGYFYNPIVCFGLIPWCFIVDPSGLFGGGPAQATKNYTKTLKEILKLTNILVQIEDEIISIIEDDLALDTLIPEAKEIFDQEAEAAKQEILEYIFQVIPDEKRELIRDVIQRHLTGGTVCLSREYQCEKNVAGDEVRDFLTGNCVVWECKAGEFYVDPIDASMLQDIKARAITPPDPRKLKDAGLTKEQFMTNILDRIINLLTNGRSDVISTGIFATACTLPDLFQKERYDPILETTTTVQLLPANYGDRIIKQICNGKSLTQILEIDLNNNLELLKNGDLLNPSSLDTILDEYLDDSNLEQLLLGKYKDYFDVTTAKGIVDDYKENIIPLEITEEIIGLEEGATIEDIIAEHWTKIINRIFGVINLDGIIINGDEFKNKKAAIIKAVGEAEQISGAEKATVKYITDQINQQADEIASTLADYFSDIQDLIEETEFVQAIREVDPSNVAGTQEIIDTHITADNPFGRIMMANRQGTDDIKEYIEEEIVDNDGGIITTDDIENVYQAIRHVIRQKTAFDGGDADLITVVTDGDNAKERIEKAIDEIKQAADWQLKDLIDAPRHATRNPQGGLRIRAQEEIDSLVGLITGPTAGTFANIRNIINNADANTPINEIKDDITFYMNILIEMARRQDIITEIETEDEPESLFKQITDGLNEIKQRIFDAIEFNASPTTDKLNNIINHIDVLRIDIRDYTRSLLIDRIPDSEHYLPPWINTIVNKHFDKIKQAVDSHISIIDLKSIASNELRALENEIGSLERITDDDMKELHAGLAWVMEDAWSITPETPESMARNIDKNSAIGITKNRAEIKTRINEVRVSIKSSIRNREDVIGDIIDESILEPDEAVNGILDTIDIIIDRHFDKMAELAMAPWMQRSSTLKERIVSKFTKIKEEIEELNENLPKNDENKDVISLEIIKEALTDSFFIATEIDCQPDGIFDCYQDLIFETIDDNSELGVYQSLDRHEVETKSLIKNQAIDQSMLSSGQTIDDVIDQVNPIVELHYENIRTEIKESLFLTTASIKLIVNNQFKEMEESIRNAQISGLDLAIVKDILAQQRGQCSDDLNLWVFGGQGSCSEGSLLSDIDAALVSPGIVGRRINKAVEHWLELVQDSQELRDFGPLLIQGIIERTWAVILAQILSGSSSNSFLYLAEDTVDVRKQIEKFLAQIAETGRRILADLLGGLLSIIGSIF